MITCPICEYENRDEEYCNQCGAKLEGLEANEPDEVSVEAQTAPVEVQTASSEAEAPEESVGAGGTKEPVAEAEAPEESSTEVPDVCAGCQKVFTGDEKFCPGCGQPRQEAPALEKSDEEAVTGPRLILLQNDDEIKSYPVAESEPLTIGRLETNTISFPEDGYTSSNHAKVELAEGEYFIEDLDSTNGTLIKIKRYRLSPGDIVFIGSNTFKFEL